MPFSIRLMHFLTGRFAKTRIIAITTLIAAATHLHMKSLVFLCLLSFRTFSGACSMINMVAAMSAYLDLAFGHCSSWAARGNEHQGFLRYLDHLRQKPSICRLLLSSHSYVPMRSLEVLFSPVELGLRAGRFKRRHVRGLRHPAGHEHDGCRARPGARAIVPVSGIPEALAIRAQRTDVLLAGEQRACAFWRSSPVESSLHGNSPREFRREMSRQNDCHDDNEWHPSIARGGSRPHGAGGLLSESASYRRLAHGAYASAAHPDMRGLTKSNQPIEDVLCAGALCDLLWTEWCVHDASDSGLIARKLFQLERPDLLAAVSESRNCRRLLSIPALKDDVAFCLQRDLFSTVLEMDKERAVLHSAGSN